MYDASSYNRGELFLTFCLNLVDRIYEKYKYKGVKS